MILKTPKSLWSRRKAISPVVGAVLLIALTVTAAAIVVFVVVPMLRGKQQLVFTSWDFDDINSNDYADKFTINLENIGTEHIIINEVSFQRNGEVISWAISGSVDINISPNSDTRAILTADSESDECGYGDFVVLVLPYGKKALRVEIRMTAEFGRFNLIYDEDFESGVPSDWVHYLFTTHGGGTHTLSDWVIEETGGNHYWACTNNDCQFITLEDPSRAFWDVNLSYDLMSRGVDSNGVIFRFDKSGAYPRFYIVWFTLNHPGPANGPHAGEVNQFTWATPSDEIQTGMITVHYVEGFDAGGGEIGYKWYKIKESSWSRTNNQWYTWRVITDGSNMLLEVYGASGLEKTMSFSDTRISQGYVGLISFSSKNSCFDNIYVW